MRYKIVLSFESPHPIPLPALKACAIAASVQVEDLPQNVENLQITACRINENGKRRVYLSPNQIKTIYEAMDMLRMNYSEETEASHRAIHRSAFSVEKQLARC